MEQQVNFEASLKKENNKDILQSNIYYFNSKPKNEIIEVQKDDTI